MISAGLTIYFCTCRNTDMPVIDVIRYADMFAALGAEPRLRIVRSLLSAHPDGLVVGEIQAETGISGSTLSHHSVPGEHGGVAGAPGVSVCGVLHPEQSG